MSDTIQLVSGAAYLVGGVIAGFLGGKKGASSQLNGTASAVVRIEQKLDGHIEQTAENFRDISDRTSTIEGRLNPVEPPTRKRAMAAKRKS